MDQHRFEAVLERPQGTGTWTYFVVPSNVDSAFLKSRVQVRGTIDGVTFRSSLLPGGDGRHFMVVNKETRNAIGKSVGDNIKVTLEIDTSPRIVDVPEDLKLNLKLNVRAQEFFNRLPYSHKKLYVDWIDSSKKIGTRENRIRKSIEMLSKSRRLK